VFSGLSLEARLSADNMTAQCGLVIIDLKSGNIAHALNIDGVVQELFDVAVLPNVRKPRALGFQDDDIDRLISFPGSGGIMATKPTVERPGLSQPVQVPGVPRTSQLDHVDERAVKYQKIYNLTPESLLPYEAMTYPSMEQHWLARPQRGELIGISASVEGKMIGLAIAEGWWEDGLRQVELLSSYVLPAYRHQPIERQLHQHLQQAMTDVAPDVKS
jgi:hypothetical protein